MQLCKQYNKPAMYEKLERFTPKATTMADSALKIPVKEAFIMPPKSYYAQHNADCSD